MSDGDDTLGNAHVILHRRELAEPAFKDDTDPLIALFKKDVDRTLLVENLRRTFDQRARRMSAFIRARQELRNAQAGSAGAEPR